MAMTIIEAAMLEQKKLRKGVLQAFWENLQPTPAERIPWEGTTSLGVTVAMLSQVDTPTMRNLNPASITAWQARFDQMQETLKILENTIIIDPVLLEIKDTVQDLRVSQVTAYMRTVNYLVNDLFINGDGVTNPTNPTGLKYRLENDAKFSGQTVDAGVSAAFDVDASSAAMYQWLDYIDQAIYKIDGGKPDAIICNQQTWLRFWSILRQLKLLDTTKDQFDREILKYRGIPILDSGVKTAGAILGGASNQVILEGNGASGGETSPIYSRAYTTSMYFVKFGPDYTLGLQLGGGLDVKHYGELGSATYQDVTRLRWVFGFATFHPRCIARLCGLVTS